MSGKTILNVLGIVYVAIGILGFIPGIVQSTAVAGEGLLLGIFAVNTIHNLAHIILGAAMLWAARSTSMMSTSKILAVVFALLVVASIIAPLRSGLAINAPDTILHLVTLLLTGYVGFMGRTTAPAT